VFFVFKPCCDVRSCILVTDNLPCVTAMGRDFRWPSCTAPDGH
jgi:hypothetical protein